LKPSKFAKIDEDLKAVQGAGGLVRQLEMKLRKEELPKELIATIVKESSDSVQKNGNTKHEATTEFAVVNSEKAFL